MKTDRILLSHGGGGLLMHELVRDMIVSKLKNPVLEKMEDAAVLPRIDGEIALTTDSYVVNPIFFPGGNIGKLSVCGTVNDLAVQGAEPVAITLSFILEEGFLLAEFERILDSIASSVNEASVIVVAGDLKVVEKGAANGVFINTAGTGRIPEGRKLSAQNVISGDVIIINGPIADHGIAVMIEREGLKFDSEIISDCAPLNGLIAALLKAVPDVRCMKDATRGGVAGVLTEIAESAGVTIEIDEDKIPVNEPTRAACDLLGLDPLIVANEGKVIAVCPAEQADNALEAMRKNEYGKQAKIIGRITGDESRVLLNTAVGGSRIVDMPYGELLPRIC